MTRLRTDMPVRREHLFDMAAELEGLIGDTRVMEDGANQLLGSLVDLAARTG